ncbi:sensor histidine kinase [Coraliomargarita parva]|uniref:sensor histidine kinase n=1 Tax=Coraliomargarita parva TaxID=3014050 RepID=UPI0022B2E5D4|nr:ATP-binding protein [Coraliomargarita parva]
MSAFLLISSILNLFAAVVLTIFVYSASGRGPVRNRFILFLLTITGWTLGYALWQITNTEASALLFTNILICFAAFIPATFFHLALTLAEKKSGFFLALSYCLAGASVATAPFHGLVENVAHFPSYGYWPQAGLGLSLVIASFGLYVPLSAMTLLYGARQHMGMRSSQINFVLGSASIGFIGGVTNFPLWYGIEIPPYGNVVVFVYLLMVGYGIYNRRITGISVDVFKALVFILLAGSFAMFYVLLMVAYGLFTGSGFGGSNYWLNGLLAFFVSAVLLWGVPKFRNWAEHMLDVLLRKEHLSTVSRLKDLPHSLSQITDEEELYRRAADALVSVLGVPGAVVLIRGSFDSLYSCRYRCGTFAEVGDAIEIRLDDPLITFLEGQKGCLVFDQIYGEVPEDVESSMVHLRQHFDVAALIPILSGSTVYGAILLGSLPGAAIWPDENLALLDSIGAQLGLNFRVRDLERKSNEVDKLVALGTMAAGLSHEIRNPLVSIQTLAGLLDSGRPLEKMGDSFKSVVLRDVKRISSIVEGVAMFSENRVGQMQPVEIGAILRESIQINEAGIQAKGVSVEMKGDLGQHVYGNFDQLVQVLNNLMENALHAIEGVESPRLEIDVREIRVRSRENWLEVRIADNGPGVPEAIRERIFDPFITSKDTGLRSDKKGMGLGLAISKRIVENHSGGLAVSNRKDGGAEFVLSLKCMNFSGKNGDHPNS